MPFEVEILATNEDAFKQDILLANKDPYGQGWLIKVRALQPETACDDLITGVEAVAYFKQRIEDNEIRCFRCVDDAIPMDME